ncbi:serine/threonine-protein kinase/endoribonuclease IRE2-like [Daphnia carinata]|uniref:serine/threonine-protein kinase/endoribonuclease IRE2-like n=1 Tax=Daphnia carinata TaxID=120202 RepID=UPI002580E49A|nr:serine/threonine-protein kinase/endoribonuclease IRE2-like [Daphnia carinata]XP_057372394.1 serine/threonine-protein kinase/endoribonuclease IRE2-like [Daphnia carinata]XP_057372395.1 serine/threonine-protein kinase/endoribonuclease IRE2-like [Daphnia carinata]
MAQEQATKGDPSLTFIRSQILGKGRYGTVFAGKYYGKDVAVKRIELERINLREQDLFQLHHENVVKLYHWQNNEDFRFYVLELCAANLEEYCKGDYKEQIPSEAEVLYQLATGLEYIHLKRIHRDIKPKNILISKPDPFVKIKYADFGSSKLMNDNGSCSMSDVRGTKHWIAPEHIPLRNVFSRGSKQSDIFSVGLVFFYFLKRGTHPFGQDSEIESNIEKGTPANIHKLAEDHFAKAVITKMIAHQAKDRMALEEIIQVLKTFLQHNPPRDADNQLLLAAVNTASSAEIVSQQQQSSSTAVRLHSSMGPPSAPLPVRLPKKPALRKELGENIMSIVDVLSGRKKKSKWAIEVRVVHKSKLDYMDSIASSIPRRRYFDLTLEDKTGKIQARACTAKICEKFYKKFKVGERYLIKQLTMKKSSDNTGPILAFQYKTEVSLC